MSKHSTVSVPLHLSFTVSGEESPTGLWRLWCESHNMCLQRSEVIPVLCFQTQIEIHDEKMLLRASGQQQKEYLHLLLETGRISRFGRDSSCPKSRCCPGISWDAMLPCLSPVKWALQAVHQPASFLKWQDCSCTSLIDTAQP